MVSYRVFGLLMLTMLVLSACGPVAGSEAMPDPTTMPCDEDVSWDQAIEILNTGQVETVMQLHSLEVSFMLENGCNIRTVEPRIDDILEKLRKCGDSCQIISFATE